MDWTAVLQAKLQDVEKEETLLEDLYAFFCDQLVPLSAEEGNNNLSELPQRLVESIADSKYCSMFAWS